MDRGGWRAMLGLLSRCECVVEVWVCERQEDGGEMQQVMDARMRREVRVKVQVSGSVRTVRRQRTEERTVRGMEERSNRNGISQVKKHK